MILVSVSQPFDLVKVRMQNGNLASSSFSTAVKYIVKNDGFRGLYRGVGPVAIGTPLILAVNIWAFNMFQRVIFSLTRPKGQTFEGIHQLTLMEIGYAGLLSSIPTSLLVAPAELIKVRLQVAAKSSKLSSLQVIRNTIKNGQVTRGLGTTLARDCFGSFCYFMVYESGKRFFRSQSSDGSLSPLPMLFAGGIAGCVNWTIAMPFDNIKTRLQANPTQTLEMIVQDLNQKGFSSYFTGLRPTLIRAFPASCAFFGGVETTLWVFRNYK